jgi:hypothetical protein
MGSHRRVLVLLVCGACASDGERLLGELRGRGFALGSGDSLREGRGDRLDLLVVERR